MELLTNLHRPGGCSASLGVVSYEGRRFVVKGDCMGQPPLINALKEVCSNDIYSYYGCHAQRLALAELPWIFASNAWAQKYGEWIRVPPPPDRCTSELPTHFGKDCDGAHDADPYEYTGLAGGTHVVSEWIEGFTTFSEALIAQVLAEAPLPSLTVQLEGTAYEVPVVGIGQILAVALLVNDVDCLGNGGKNVGYTVIPNEDNEPRGAKAIKIDPGEAFTGYQRAADASEAEHLRTREESLLLIRRKHVYVGTSRVAHVDTLPGTVKQEFDSAMSSVLATTDEDVEAFFCREGLEGLFPDAAALRSRVEFLIERRNVLREVYGRHRDSDTPTPQLPAISSSSDALRYLKEKYHKTAIIRDPVTLKYYPVEQRFVNLALLASSGKARYDSDGAEAMLSSYAAIRAPKTSIEMKDLFTACKGSTRRVNVKGCAGIGKSTCCQCVVNAWACDRLFQEFMMVLWIPLRNLTSARYPNGDCYDAVDVIIRECLELQMSPELRVLVSAVYAPETTLWILDGYDEIVNRVPSQLSDVLTVMLGAPNRILTGRPNAMELSAGSLAAVPGLTCDVEVEVAGFSDDNVREFVSRFVSSSDSGGSADGGSGAWVRAGAASPTMPLTPAAGFTPAAGGVLLSHRPSAILSHPLYAYLRRNRLAWELAHIPINLVLLCHVLSSERELSLSQRLTLTELYERVEKLMLQRYCVTREGENMALLTSERQAAVTSALMECLSNVAFDAMREGIVMIGGDRVDVWIQAARQAGLSVSWRHVLGSGLIVQAGGSGSSEPKDSQYHFLHLTLQEYFAAKGIAAALMGARDWKLRFDAGVVEWLRANKDLGHLEVMWWFVAGILGQKQSAQLEKALANPRSLQGWEEVAECRICGCKFGLLLPPRRHHCRKCYRSVCNEHSKFRVQLSGWKESVRVCDECVPAATPALTTMLSWWSSSLRGGMFAGPGISQVKLWLQIAEQGKSLAGEHDNVGFRDILLLIGNHVLADVLAVLSGRKEVKAVPWFGTLQQCPRMTARMLFENSAFEDAMKAAFADRGSGQEGAAFMIVRALGDPVLDCDWMANGVLRKELASPTVQPCVLDALTGLSDVAVENEWVCQGVVRALRCARYDVRKAAARVLRAIDALMQHHTVVRWFQLALESTGAFLAMEAFEALMNLGPCVLEHTWLGCWLRDATASGHMGQRQSALCFLRGLAPDVARQHDWIAVCLPEVWLVWGHWRLAAVLLCRSCCAQPYLSEDDAIAMCERLKSIPDGEPWGDEDAAELYAVMDVYLTVEAVQAAAVEALQKHAQFSAHNCEKIVQDDGGLGRVFAAMDYHVSSAAVQLCACRTLFNIAFYCERGTAKREMARNNGACARFDRAMEVHRDDSAPMGVVWWAKAASELLEASE